MTLREPADKFVSAAVEMTGVGTMSTLNRRAFMLASVAALSATTSIVRAAPAPAPRCSSPSVPAAVVPNRLLVDCASRRNFRLFRANPDYVRLTGVVTLNVVQGKLGTYPAGLMMLFPQLTPKGVALGASRAWPSYITTGTNMQMSQVDAIRNLMLPPDDYFCRLVLQAPWTSMLGFSVDAPTTLQPGQTWLAEVDALGDGKGVNIDWSSASLNAPWFAGRSWIPADRECDGKAWRRVIADGVSQASVGLC